MFILKEKCWEDRFDIFHCETYGYRGLCIISQAEATAWISLVVPPASPIRCVISQSYRLTCRCRPLPPVPSSSPPAGRTVTFPGDQVGGDTASFDPNGQGLTPVRWALMSAGRLPGAGGQVDGHYVR